MTLSGEEGIVKKSITLYVTEDAVHFFFVIY